MGIFSQIANTSITSLKYFRRNPIKGINFFLIRNLISLCIIKNYILKKDYVNEGFSFDNDGFAPLKRLSSYELETITSLFLVELSKKGQNYTNIFDYFENNRSKGYVRPSGIILDCNNPQISKFLNDHDLINISRNLLGISKENLRIKITIDALININVQRKFINGYDDALEAHRDIDSYKFLKIFYYLTDIDVNDGHHEVFIKSHKNIPLNMRFIKRYKDEEILKFIPHSKLVKVSGKKGYGFIENTTTFHRGTKPTKKDRLMITIAINDKSIDYFDNNFQKII